MVIAEKLEEFLRKNPDYYFVFVGNATVINGEEFGYMLRRMAGKYRDRVIIWVALPHKQLYPIIRKAEFVVLPSLMDNFPNACIEAMYFGIVSERIEKLNPQYVVRKLIHMSMLLQKVNRKKWR